MAEKIKKIKGGRWFILVIIMIIIIIIRAYLNSPFTHVEERRIINYALQGSRGDFKISSVSMNRDLKDMNYVLLDKGSYNVESIFKIRLRMNEYLKKNPDYFSNDGYCISISWVDTPSGGPPILSLTNLYGEFYGRDDPVKTIREFEALDCLVLYGDSRKFSLSSISDVTLYEDIKGLLLEEYTYIDDIEIINNFKSLEFFKPNNSVTDEDIKRIKEIHPNCEIYGR